MSTRTNALRWALCDSSGTVTALSRDPWGQTIGEPVRVPESDGDTPSGIELIAHLQDGAAYLDGWVLRSCLQADNTLVIVEIGNLFNAEHQIRVFGGLRVMTSDGRVLADNPQGLAYDTLITIGCLQSDWGASRSEVARGLWPIDDQKVARRRLRRMLTKLMDGPRPAGVPDNSIIENESGLWLNTRQIEFDVHRVIAFRDLLLRLTNLDDWTGIQRASFGYLTAVDPLFSRGGILDDTTSRIPALRRSRQSVESSYANITHFASLHIWKTAGPYQAALFAEQACNNTVTSIVPFWSAATFHILAESSIETIKRLYDTAYISRSKHPASFSEALRIARAAADQNARSSSMLNVQGFSA